MVVIVIIIIVAVVVLHVVVVVIVVVDSRNLPLKFGLNQVINIWYIVVVVVVIIVVVVSGAVVIKTCFYFDLLNLKILPRDISAAKIAESLLLILSVISNTNPDGAEIVWLVNMVFFALGQTTHDLDKLTAVLV